MPKRQRISHAQTQLPFAGSARLVQAPLKYEWRALTIAGGALLVTAMVYGYCVVNSIAQVSMRETALKETRALVAARTTLESEYLKKTRALTLEYAKAAGYQKPTDRVFVTRSGSLTLATDAR